MNDDRIILTDEGDGFRAWGAPWPGEGGIARAIDAPLGALAFLKHGTNLSVRELRPTEATRRLYETIALPLWSGQRTAEALERIDRLVARLPLLEFAYPPTPEAAREMVAILGSACSG